MKPGDPVRVRGVSFPQEHQNGRLGRIVGMEMDATPKAGPVWRGRMVSPDHPDFPEDIFDEQFLWLATEEELLVAEVMEP